MPSVNPVPVGHHQVSRIGLGGARWSISDPMSEAAVERLLIQAVTQGVRYIDTARAYTTPEEESHNERLIRRTLDRCDLWGELLVATKGGHHRDGDRYRIDGRPDALVLDCEQSLRALGREQLDLYYLHFPDPRVPIEESVGALADLRQRGLVADIGLCNVTMEQLQAASAVTDIAAVQNPLSPYYVERDIVDLCRAKGVAFFGYSPLGGSRATVPLSALSTHAQRAATRREISIETTFLAWLLTLAPNIVLITGARRAASLTASVAAASVALTVTEREGIAKDLASRDAAH